MLSTWVQSPLVSWTKEICDVTYTTDLQSDRCTYCRSCGTSLAILVTLGPVSSSSLTDRDEGHGLDMPD